MSRQCGPRKRRARAIESARATLRARFEAAYPPCGPCMFCGSFDTEDGKQGFHDARHRLVDAIRSRRKAGDSVDALARDCRRSVREIRLALAWGGV